MIADSIEIQTCEPIDAEVCPPGSKSLTNRALVCAALAQGTSTLSGVLDSVDTRVMVDALNTLGIPLTANWNSCEITIQGCGGRLPANEAEIYVENSGTTARFLSSMLTLGNGRYVLDGNKRMRERPIQDLIDALLQLGSTVRSLPGTGCPPLEILAQGLAGGMAQVRGDVSSQFLSGLLLAAPYAQQAVKLNVLGTLVSIPYVDMTLRVMESFGVLVETTRNNGIPTAFEVPQAGYQATAYAIEPDASAASYFFAAAAITGGRMTVRGLSRESLQCDVAFVDLLDFMGCQVDWQADSITVTGGSLKGITADMNAISDTVMTLAAVALFAEGPTTITHVEHVRHKETDRIAALCTELRKLGALVDERPDGLQITPRPLHAATLDTYDDHRMAMSLALAGLRVPGVVINDPGCTSKTYPHFFQDLERVCRRPRTV